MSKIRVLIVDDSSLMREAIRSILAADDEIEVVGMAKDGKEGVEKALKLKPNVITMDLKMPQMSGLEAIEEIMQTEPISIIVVSSVDVKVVVKALDIGAMDFISVSQDIETIAHELLEKVKIASRVRPLRRMKKISKPAPSKPVVKARTATKVVAIGVSTGGPQALMAVLRKLPADFNACVIVVQHMSRGFIEGMAEWLKSGTFLDVKVAKAGDIVKNGTVLIAPDDCHLEVIEDGSVSLREDKVSVCAHVPSIDVMMKSVAKVYGPTSLAVIMTGMGRDGVDGVCAIKKAGGVSIAQDRESSVIFGMNKVAYDVGCVDRMVPLDDIAAELINFSKT